MREIIFKGGREYFLFRRTKTSSNDVAYVVQVYKKVLVWKFMRRFYFFFLGGGERIYIGGSFLFTLEVALSATWPSGAARR